MNEKILSALTRTAIIIIGICGLLTCLLWVPMSIGKGSLEELSWTMFNTSEFWIQYVLHWIVSLHCFWLLVIAWQITLDMDKGRLFLTKNALRVNRATIILIADIIAFVIGNIVFALLGWSSWFVLHIFVAITGLILSIFMYILSKYLMRAAILQEESDLTV